MWLHGVARPLHGQLQKVANVDIILGDGCIETVRRRGVYAYGVGVSMKASRYGGVEE
jgi:hypothetical protein